MAEYIRTNSISSIKSKKVFFDTNIWLYMFCEIGDYKDWLIRKYAYAFQYILKNDILIYTDFSIISEFVNRYLRMQFEQYKTKEKDFTLNYKKNYRNTDDFKEAWENICIIIKESILEISNIINYNHTDCSISTILDPANFDIDINDSHIITICKENDMYLMTNDRDFKDAGINIISANKSYFNK